MVVTREDFIRETARESEFTVAEIRAVLETMQDLVTDHVKARDSIKAFKFLQIAGNEKEEHTARNPKTGASILVPAHTVPSAKFMKSFKDYVK